MTDWCEPEGRMDQWKVIRVGREIRVQRTKDMKAVSAPEETRAKTVITHQVKLKLPKALRRMWSFWG
jgi:hypothetical protein